MLILMYTCIKIYEARAVRTTVTIDDDLYQKAISVADPSMDKADLFRESVKTFIRVQAAKRLAALGGSAPDMQPIHRRNADITPNQ